MDQTQTSRTTTVTADALRPGIEWLASDQHPEAVVSHHGITTRIGDYSVTVAPQPPAGRNSGAVVVFNQVEYEYEADADTVSDGIGPDQLDELQAIVEQVAPVLYRWNGVSCACLTCSFNIDVEVSAAIRHAKTNYVAFERPAVRPTMPEGWVGQ